MSNHAHAPQTVSASLDPRRLRTVGLVAASGLLGALAGIEPRLAVAAIAAGVVVPIVLSKPIVGLCALLFISFLEWYSGMTGTLSMTKIIGALLILGWLAVVATSTPAERAQRGLVRHVPLVAVAVAVFATWVCLSLVWAEDPGEGFNALSRFALNFMLFPIVLGAVWRPKHVVSVFVVFIAGALVAAALGLLAAPGGAAEEGRLAGAGLNPNQLGELLVVAIVFATTLATMRRWPAPVRITALVAAGLGAIALYMTLSRGALLGLGVALIIAPFAVGRGRRAAAVVLAIAAVVGTVGWFAAIAPDEAVDRVTHPERAGGSGREDLWRVGWRMVEDRPAGGVGAGNYRVSSIHYLLRPGSTQRDEFIVDTPRVAHNVYLTVLAELGIIGFVLFALILVACLGCAARAARVFARRGDAVMEMFSRSLLISLMALLATAFFSSQLYSKQLWLLLALAPALLVMAKRAAPDDGSATPPLRGPTAVNLRAAG